MPPRFLRGSRTGGIRLEPNLPIRETDDRGPTALSSPGGRLALACAATFLVAAVTFWGSLRNGFAFDDVTLIAENDRVASIGATIASLGEPYMFPGEHGKRVGLWRPVTTMYYGAARAVFGLSPAGFHAVNLVLNGAISVLVLLLALRFLPMRGAVAAALLFATHPVHSEAVANVVGVAELIPAALALIAILLFLRWRGEGDPGSLAPGRYGPARLAALAFLYGMAVLAKESAIVLPGILVLLDLTIGRAKLVDLGRYARARLGLVASLGVVGLAVLAGRFAVLGGAASAAPPLGTEVLQEMPRVWTVLTVWPHYFRLLFFPRSLSAEYAPDLIPVQFGLSPMGVLGLALVLTSLVVAWFAWRADAVRDRGASVVTLGVLWFVVTMLPVSNLLFGSSVLLAERTLYFPSIGFVLMVGWAFAAAVPSSVGGARLWRRVPVYGLAAVVLLAFSFRSAVRVPTWESTTSVTSTLAVQHPQLARSQEWLARRLIRAGDIQGGVEALYRAERIVGYPGNFTLQFEGGRLLVSSGRPDLAIRFFESAMVLAPDAPRRDAARRELDAAWRAVMAVAAHAYEGG